MAEAKLESILEILQVLGCQTWIIGTCRTDGRPRSKRCPVCKVIRVNPRHRLHHSAAAPAADEYLRLCRLEK